MAEHTLAEMGEQAVKAARYFAAGMEKHSSSFVALRSGNTVVVIARSDAADVLEAFVNGGGIGETGPGVENVETHAPLAPPVVPPRDESPEAVESGVTVIGQQDVVLIPMYHEPPAEHATKKGHVHLHVLNGAKVGRRVRVSGECLCSKKHGSKERQPDGETDMCKECVSVAAENGIPWQLA